MNQVGSIGLIAAFAFAIYAVVAGAVGGKLRSVRVTKSAERAALAFFAMITMAVFALEYLILTDNFHSAYVASHSNRALPIYYKFPVLWSGQEGSLLWWTWLLAMYSALVVLMNRRKNRQLMPYVVSVLMGVGVFFSSLVVFVANPFTELSIASAGKLAAFTPPDGNGLNPSLQYPSMVIHPPMLYLGYVGMVVPFAFAVAALITRQLGDNWIRTTRRWTMVPWMFLGVGIILGGNWAYEVLGWGGYWAWDPVENASLLPWLAGTAFLHSVMIQEKRGMLKVWNIVLVMATFALSIFGTFLTRSGIVSSVHAFAQSNIGPFFATFLGIIVLFSLTLLFLRLEYLKSENQLDSVVSRESGFLFNNWVLLAAVFAVLWGTIFPILSKAVENQTVTVGPPFFNRFMIPIGLILLFLTGAGPLLAWRKTSFQSIRQNFTLPLVLALIAGAVLFTLGVRSLYPWMALFLAAFVTVSILGEFYKGARTRQHTLGENFVQAVSNLTMKNTRRYGGYVIHLGIVILFVGFVGQAFKTETKGLMGQGDLLRAGDYLLRCESVSTGENDNYQYERAVLSVTRNGRAIGSLDPEIRLFKASQERMSHVAIRSTLAQDLYVVLAGQDPDTQKAIVQVFINPLVVWVWLGGVVMFLGTLLALVPSRVEREMAQIRQQQEEEALSVDDFGHGE
ncbi:MAG TPA: heme lyase CcmF/NrfE family subunit [Terriglobia bacterium]|nr:heme lyase CcmF/NrfE family subunit [Terriglobia bacterium]